MAIFKQPQRRVPVSIVGTIAPLAEVWVYSFPLFYMAAAKFCGCHECTQVRYGEKKALTGWFDIIAIALFVVLGTAYFIV